MKIVKLTKDNEKEILSLAVKTLLEGKTVVYPTDTSYGLGAVGTNPKAIARVRRIKERGPKPLHFLIPSVAYAKKIIVWNASSKKLAKEFWPGPLSMSLPLKVKDRVLKVLADQSGNLGLRFPNNSFALKLVKKLKFPITATSANPSSVIRSGYDPYSAQDVIKQFTNLKFKPDLIIDAGQLKRVKPSTFVIISNDGSYKVTRKGPISEAKIRSCLSKK